MYGKQWNHWDQGFILPSKGSSQWYPNSRSNFLSFENDHLSEFTSLFSYNRGNLQKGPINMKLLLHQFALLINTLLCSVTSISLSSWCFPVFPPCLSFSLATRGSCFNCHVSAWLRGNHSPWPYLPIFWFQAFGDTSTDFTGWLSLARLAWASHGQTIHIHVIACLSV